MPPIWVRAFSSRTGSSLPISSKQSSSVQCRAWEVQVFYRRKVHQEAVTKLASHAKLQCSCPLQAAAQVAATILEGALQKGLQNEKTWHFHSFARTQPVVAADDFQIWGQVSSQVCVQWVLCRTAGFGRKLDPAFCQFWHNVAIFFLGFSSVTLQRIPLVAFCKGLFCTGNC